MRLSLIHISEPTRLLSISYAVFCLKKKETKKLTKDQSFREIQKLKKDLFNMRFKKVNGQIQNVAEFSKIKKNIARLYNNIEGKK